MFNRKSATPTLVFIAGEGGHMEQARRVLASLESDVRSSSHCILITDVEPADSSEFDACWIVETCAPKHRSSGIRDGYVYMVSSARTLFRLARHHDVRLAIVTGPGFAMIPALGAKLLGAHLIVFESWSRFENRSKCGQALYRFADEFLVQHQELLKLYPKGVWVGLL